MEEREEEVEGVEVGVFYVGREAVIRAVEREGGETDGGDWREV